MYAHVCAYACKNVFSTDIFDILTFLALNSLIYKHLTDLQKFRTRTFIFASPNFCKSKLLSLIEGEQNTLAVLGTEYLAFEGTKRLLGINHLAG